MLKWKNISKSRLIRGILVQKLKVSLPGKRTKTVGQSISKEIIIRRDDLKQLGVIPRQFPDPVFLVDETKYSNIRDSLVQSNPDVLTDDLPRESMDTGCVSMKIHLTLGEKTPLRILTA